MGSRAAASRGPRDARAATTRHRRGRWSAAQWGCAKSSVARARRRSGVRSRRASIQEDASWWCRSRMKVECMNRLRASRENPRDDPSPHRTNGCRIRARHARDDAKRRQDHLDLGNDRGYRSADRRVQHGHQPVGRGRPCAPGLQLAARREERRAGGDGHARAPIHSNRCSRLCFPGGRVFPRPAEMNSSGPQEPRGAPSLRVGRRLEPRRHGAIREGLRPGVGRCSQRSARPLTGLTRGATGAVVRGAYRAPSPPSTTSIGRSASGRAPPIARRT